MATARTAHRNHGRRRPPCYLPRVGEVTQRPGPAPPPQLAAPLLGPPSVAEPRATAPVGAFRRALWSFAGQGISSASNFVLSATVLSVASAGEFATFSICVTSYAFVLQLTRASVAVPATLVQTGVPERDDQQQQAAVGVAVATAAVVAAVILGVAPFVRVGGAQLVALGVLLPLLLFQDSLRYVCYARGHPSLAAWSDGLWLLIQVVGSAVLLALGSRSAAALIAIWGAGGALSGLLLAARMSLVPRVRAGGDWLRANRALCRRLVTEFLVGSSSHYAVYYGLAIVAGAGELGRVKAAQTLLGPVIVLVLGGYALGVPESVRAAADRPRLRRLVSRLAAFLVATAVVCGVAAYALVPVFGPSLFPNAWESARPLLPALTVFAAAAGVSAAVTSALRALDDNAWLLAVRTRTCLVLIPTGLLGSALFGAQGALAAIAAVEWAVVLVSWARLRGHLASVD